MSLEDLFELIDAFTRKNKLIDGENKIEAANFASHRNDHSEEKNSNGEVVNHREKDWTTRL